LGSRNVYADLGFPDPDAMLVKAQLVTKIAEILETRGLTQLKAAGILGVPQPKLSKLLRGQFRGFSERKLMDCLVRLGRDVQIVVRDSGRRRGSGTVSVVFG
jgi:predicted XRE-type DNA-binding protein